MSRIEGFMTVAEVRRTVGMSPGTICMLMREGKLKYMKRGKVRRIPLAEVQRLAMELEAKKGARDRAPPVVGGLKQMEQDTFIGPGGGPCEPFDRVIGGEQ